MAEVTKELIYQTLGRIQVGINATHGKTDELKAEMQALRGHMVSLQQDLHNIYTILDRHDGRLDRIERRLDLVEPA